MIHLLHLSLVALYLALPPAALLWTAWRARRRAAWPPFILSLFSGGIIGSGLVFAYAVIIGGQASTRQYVEGAYFGVSILLLLKAFDQLARRAWRPSALALAPPRRRALASAAAEALRIATLFGVGLPFLMSAVMVYRPRVVPEVDPRTRFSLPFTAARFDALDGVAIAAWWIPAAGGGDRSVVLVHGLGAGKAEMLPLARDLATRGLNVLAIDLRSHGGSGGRTTSFGVRERLDVLAAARWLRQTQPGASRQIYAVGASMGGAAVIAAAADLANGGEAIDAVVVYAAFDDLDRLARDVAERHFHLPLRPLVARFGLPLASLHSGADLRRFAPARLVAAIWPRPVMVIHAQRDEVIPFARGQALYHAAHEPRRRLWVDDSTHHDVLENESIAAEVVRFLSEARPVPMI